MPRPQHRLQRALIDPAGKESELSFWKHCRGHCGSQILAGEVRGDHQFYREALARLNQLLAKVWATTAASHARLVELQIALQEIEDHLLPHMEEEEEILFPCLQRLERASRCQEPVPRLYFGSISDAVELMRREHQHLRERLRHMQEVSTETINAEAGTIPRELRQALQDFARGLRAHLAFEERTVFRLAKAEESLIRESG
jgi:iron-sulfur cluster repair protein YtfE (RIC family)